MTRMLVLEAQQVTKIHEATLRLLEETGIVLTHPAARELLLNHGARALGDRMLLPADLVQSCVTQCPDKVTLQGRDPEKRIQLGTGTWYAHNVGGVPNVLLTDGKGQHRPATRRDVAESTRLLDALTNVSSVTPLFTPLDVSPEAMTAWMYYDTVINTTKPIRAPGVQTAREVRALAEMARIAYPHGSLTVGISPISPLTFPDDVAEAMMEAARLGLILGPLPCPIMGATAPMSIAGGLTQQNAEVLASIALAQLVHPGLPVIYKGRLSMMHPRSGLSVWGNPEIGLISAATAAIGHFYQLPVDVYGLTTNAHVPDIQNGYERALNALTPVLAGADEISGVGEIDGGTASCLEQMVIDDEIVGSIRRIQRGFEVSPDALALDVLSEVMAGPRNFLAEPHTVKYLRGGEMLQTTLAERRSWSEWEATGRNDIVARAAQQASQLLASHTVPPLENEVMAELDQVIRSETEG